MPEKGFYYHYKHDPKGSFNVHAYEIFDLGRHTEDDTLLVLYRPLYENTYLPPARCFARPIEMFGDITKDGQTFPRFSKITDPDIISKLEALKREMYF